MTPAAAFRELSETLDQLRIPYLVCGSLASSVYGLPRATRDIDLVAEIRSDQVAALASALAGPFYADAVMIRDAIARQRAFNVIHFATSYKFDIFPAGSDAYTKSQFERRQLRQFTVENEEVQFQVASAEDTILSKLLWYKAGSGVSDQQWRDILSILEMQRERLELDYLHKWAQLLGVADLLDRALG